MSKIAFIFPGQGAQQLNMGMDIYKNSDVGKDYLNRADQVLDFDLIQLISDEKQPLDQTAYTQPALVAVSIALLRCLEEKIDLKPDYVAGLSLGEYSAHVASGSLDFEKAVQLVRQRGLLMEEAGAETEGAMAAVVKGNIKDIDRYCLEDGGIVSVANYNSPVQVVISGEKEAVLRVSDRLSSDKTRVVPLAVSGAFHSQLMESAALKFDKVLQEIRFETMELPLVTNVTGELVKDSLEIHPLLVNQLKEAVLWQKSVEYMINQGVEIFVEIGPSNTLAGLIKKIDRKVKVYNVNDYDSISHVANELVALN